MLFPSTFKSPLAPTKTKANQTEKMKVSIKSESSFIIPLKTSSIQNISRTETLPYNSPFQEISQKEEVKDETNKVITASGVEQKRKEKSDFKQKKKLDKLKLVVSEEAKQEEIKSQQNTQVSPGLLLSDDYKSTSGIEFYNIQNKNLENQMSSQKEDTSPYGSTSILNGVQFQGRWTQEEHKKFMEGLKLFGKDWRRIEEHIGSRTCAQIRSHAQKYFNRLSRELTKDNSNTSDKISDGIGHDGHHSNDSMKSFEHEKEAIHNQTNQQLQLIQDKFSQLAEDEITIQLQNLLVEREQLAKSLVKKRMSAKDGCERLIELTTKFHQLGIYAFANNKCIRTLFLFKDLVELCKRLVDERNITQFICILLAQRVTLVPNYQVVPLDPNTPIIQQIRDHHKHLQQLTQNLEQQENKQPNEDQLKRLNQQYQMIQRGH